MSIIPMPEWVGRKRETKQNALHDKWVENSRREAYKLPEDMMLELDRALQQESGHPPLGTPKRTAALIAQQLERLREDLADARAVVKQGEEKEAALVIELAKTVDEEIAAKKAAHDAEVAELQSLRPNTEEPS